MPRIICPICGNAYARYVKRKILFGKIAWKVYDCDNCGELHYDLRTDEWYPLCDRDGCDERLELFRGGYPAVYQCIKCETQYEFYEDKRVPDIEE